MKKNKSIDDNKMKKITKIVIPLAITIIIAGTISGIVIGSYLSIDEKKAIYHPPIGDRKYSYYHILPRSALNRGNVRILLYGHSSPYIENYSEMERYVRENVMTLMDDWCIRYGYALVIMVTPRLWGDYPDYLMISQQLSEYVMFDNDFDKPEFEFFKRPDLEFVKIIEDFKQYLYDNGHVPEEKVYMAGFSNGGTQANRFPLLFPNLIKATAIGGSGSYIYPLTTYNNTELTYPLGISNIDSISDINFTYSEYLKIPHLVFIGENDTNTDNDPVYHSDCFSEIHREIIVNNFGTNNVIRAEHFSNYLLSLGMNCTFKKYEGIGHQYNLEMQESIFKFFETIA